MAHYAKIEDGRVAAVIVAEPDIVATLSGRWVQTSYNTRRGVHYGADGEPDGGAALRANYAGLGDVYDAGNDVFYAPQPFPSWSIAAPEWAWLPPTPCPIAAGIYAWDEGQKTWRAA